MFLSFTLLCPFPINYWQGTCSYIVGESNYSIRWMLLIKTTFQARNPVKSRHLKSLACITDLTIHSTWLWIQAGEALKKLSFKWPIKKESNESLSDDILGYSINLLLPLHDRERIDDKFLFFRQSKSLTLH